MLDNDTRWDTELMLVERVIYFDNELIALYSDATVGIPADCIFTRFEFDLAYGMCLVLESLREFTKWAQLRNKVTLAYVPEKIDALLTALQPSDEFDARLLGRSAGILDHLHALQRRLFASVRQRFSSTFDGSSIALAARYLLPGNNRFAFTHFVVNHDTINQVLYALTPCSPRDLTPQVLENLVDDAVALLPDGTPEEELEHTGVMVRATLPLARAKLNRAPAITDPLVWWPGQAILAPLFGLAKMLFAVPASSADSERSFSSAGFTMGIRRTRMEVDAFRSEHRIRRFITATGDAQTQLGRQTRLDRVRRILDRFADEIAGRPALLPVPLPPHGDGAMGAGDA